MEKPPEDMMTPSEAEAEWNKNVERAKAHREVDKIFFVGRRISSDRSNSSGEESVKDPGNLIAKASEGPAQELTDKSTRAAGIHRVRFDL